MTGELPDFRRRLLAWYGTHHRTLPWRAPPGSDRPPDPYHVLVSEAMLQQTQVATVIPYFRRFLELFPTVRSLADADEQTVLRAWQGLGYYSRARNLQKAAKTIVGRFGGELPTTAEALLELPGVGRYTAGAVASIAFGRRSPILDGNVSRVLCRLDAIRSDPAEPATRNLLWARAEQILPKKRLGDFNSALMELGALVCTPRSPQCLTCPVLSHCDAAAAGLQGLIPAPKKRKPSPLLRRWVFVIRSGDRWLMEQRPAYGRWAGMWQFVTTDAPPTGNTSPDPTADPATDPAAATVRALTGLPVTNIRSTGSVRHTLTHREYEFIVHQCETARAPDSSPRQWITAAEMDRLPMPKPHVTIRQQSGI